MLARRHRLVSSRTFSSTVRRGSRAGTGTLVIHLATASRERTSPPSPIEIGFVVSKAVGPAVTRNAVKRRLRHIARERLSSLPGSSALVVRALPASTSASYATLRDDFDAAVARAIRDQDAGGRA
ncbi:MAG TPA: ribonuclease P protein component [Nocardioidaceae bacterium]|nr:ribonuclease P protein component [Nocardioidaceae bacterium]